MNKKTKLNEEAPNNNMSEEIKTENNVKANNISNPEELETINPYIKKSENAQKHKSKPKGYTLKVLSWILVILGFCLLAFILINVVITQSFISANKNDIGAIISFIVFGWIFLIFGISGGSIILTIITLLATILSVSHLIVVKGKSKAGWVILSLVVLLIISIIVILMLAKPFTSLGLT